MSIAPDGQVRRVLIVEDEPAFRVLLCCVVSGFGYDVRSAADADSGAAELASFQPHILMADLDLGTDTSGAELIHYQQSRYPEIASLIVSAHRSVALVDGVASDFRLPVAHVTKADIVDTSVLRDALERTLKGDVRMPRLTGMRHGITRRQASVLKMLADGHSNAEIARMRGCSVRSLERIINRLYQSLDLNNDPSVNPRVSAARMYRQSLVDIR